MLRNQWRRSAAASAAVIVGVGMGLGGTSAAAADPGNGNSNGNGNAAAAKTKTKTKSQTKSQGQDRARDRASTGGQQGSANPGKGATKPDGDHGKSAAAPGRSGSGAAGGQATKPETPVQAGQSKKSDKAERGGDKPESPGNNGTVKIAGFLAPNGPGHAGGDGSTPGHPSNDPHLACQFSVEWFNFDASMPDGSPIVSEVTFTQHAPTSPGAIPAVIAGATSVTLDGDPATGASADGLDATETYELDFVGEPHAKHGYHLKVTVNTPYSQGADKKSKVIWVEPCEETPGGETPGGETPGGETPGGETPGGETPGGETPGGVTPGGDTGGETPEVAGEQAQENEVDGEATQGGAESGVEVAGVQAQQRNVLAQAAQAVPTVINAGLSAARAAGGWTMSAVLVGVGLLMGAIAFLVHRRRITGPQA